MLWWILIDFHCFKYFLIDCNRCDEFELISIDLIDLNTL